MILHIDIETYSSVDITKAGAYKYTESPDFEILIFAYAFDDMPVKVIDYAQGERPPVEVLNAMRNPEVEKHAHNATFERLAFKAVGFEVPIEQWRCSAIHAAYCGLPLGLDAVSKALGLGDKAKLATGKALIKYFSCPVKATKANGGRTRNLPEHNPEKWEEYKHYCFMDVEAEREIGRRLKNYPVPAHVWAEYLIDQQINDRGIEVDLTLAQNAYDINNVFSEGLKNKMIALTGLDNPNSVAQLKQWIGEATGKEVKTLAKDVLPELLEGASDQVKEVIQLRQQGAKTSVKKYLAMLKGTCDDGRAHGLFQFYGANRTGRWAGRLIQMQNLPQNHLDDLDGAREVIRSGDYDLTTLLYDNVPSILSQLIRTAFVAKKGHTFAVADFSAIEARVIAWLAGETWRLKVFETHGKIYEASASMMFGVPMGQVTKGSDLRAKGKVAELALGYQGSVGALTTMGGERMGLSEAEMKTIVSKWREANPQIVRLWHAVENAAKRVLETRSWVKIQHGIVFSCDGQTLRIKLPSGRELFYQSPEFTINKFEQTSIKYRGMDQTTKQWTWVDTYGGKLTENIVQAVARDLLMESMARLHDKKYTIVLHVHDEVACEIPKGDFVFDRLKNICAIMGEPVSWAPGLPLEAEGYITRYYKKD